MSTNRFAQLIPPLLLAFTFSVTHISHAQNHPFPQHVSYTPGTIKPGVSQTSMDQTTTSFYDAWKTRHLVQGCQSNHYYVHYSADWTPDPPDAITVSEAHGYGMLITALMAGYDPNAQVFFNGLYRYFTNHFSLLTPYLMSWQQVSNCALTANSEDSATDGDMDIAYALLLADRQWGSSGAINYLAEARKAIAAVMKGDVNTNAWSVGLGDWAAYSGSNYFYGTRTSDFMMDHFRAYQLIGGDTNWTRVVDKCYAIINRMQTNYSTATGLLPDFVVSACTNPTPAGANYLESADDGQYNWNACRTPWRIATDYLVAGDPRALAALDKMNAWIRAKTGDNPASIRAGYNIANGAQLVSYGDLAFTSPFAVGAMVNASNQIWLNKLWTNLTTTAIGSGSYYGNTIKLINLIVLSGNWWTPTLKPTVITNAAKLPNGNFSFQLVAEPQFTNRIEASTNLVNWTTLLTTNPPTATVGFEDTQAVTLPRRFYRSR